MGGGPKPNTNVPNVDVPKWLWRGGVRPNWDNVLKSVFFFYFEGIPFDNIKTLMFASYDLNLNIYIIFLQLKFHVLLNILFQRELFFSTTFLSVDTGRPRFECSPTEKGKPGFG